MSDVTPDAENVQGSAAPASGSAPEVQNSQENAGGQVDNSEKQSLSGQADGSSKEGKREFFQRRQAEKQQNKVVSLEDQVAALSQQIESLGSHLTKKAETQDFQDDPAPAVQNQNQLTPEVIQKMIDGRLTEVQEEGAYNASAGKAENWLLTRKHIKQDPNAQAQIEYLLQTRYAKSAAVDPEAAIEAAYTNWCSQKGVAPDLEGVVDSSSALKAGGISPSGSSDGSVGAINESNVDNATMTKEQAHEYTKRFKPETKEWWAATDAIAKAMNEGRIKGLKK